MTTEVMPVARKRRILGRKATTRLSSFGVTLFTASMALIFLLPLGYMALTAVKDNTQMDDPNAPLWPATPVMYSFNGDTYPILYVPLPDGRTIQAAAEIKGRKVSTFVDISNGQEFQWTGN
jgi:multiple sugar transport system permease protein